MAGDTLLTIVGNLTADPELRFTPSGAAVANFTVASTPRHFDREANEWKDGDALFMRCSVWRQAAENVAESLTKGARVMVVGRLKQRSYEKDGQKRSIIELEVDEVGPSLKWASAQVRRAERQSTPSGYGADGDPWASGGQQQRQPAGNGQQRPPQGQQQPAQHDPWTQPPAGQPAGQQQGGGYDYDRPPF